MISEGTRSLLIGCHSFIIHPLMVLRAWRWWFGSWPAIWQIVCIFLHDIGLAGREYLSDPAIKKGHWRLGASWAERLFGNKGFLFCAGHTPESMGPRSDLWYADKASWLVAPIWWMKLNYLLDVSKNGRKVSGPWEFKLWIAKSLKDDLIHGNHFSAHQKFIDDHSEANQCQN